MIAIFLQIVSLSVFSLLSKLKYLIEILELVFYTVIIQTTPVDIVAIYVARNVSQSYFSYFRQTTCHARGVTAKLPDKLHETLLYV